MNIDDYFNKNKYEWFPGMDFRDPQDELRNMHPNDMTFTQWIWFSPILYNLQLIGLPIWCLVVFGSILVWSIFAQNWLTLALMVILLIVVIKWLLKNIDMYKHTKHMNLYDNYLREW